jgi:hypothetical protein
LEKTQVTVYESEENYVPQSVKNPKWRINVKPLEDIVNGNKNLAVWAINLYTSAWGQFGNTGTGTPITGQIVKALHQIGITYSDHFATKQGLQRFEEWFIASVKLSPDKSSWLFSTEYKHERMEQRHLGTALGIMSKYAGFARITYGNQAPKVEPIKSLYEAHDNKRAKKKDEVSNEQ